MGVNSAICLRNWTCFRGNALLGLGGDIPSGLKCTLAATASSARQTVFGQNGSSRMKKELKETMTGADIAADRNRVPELDGISTTPRVQ